ncbi:hypothetical protein DFH09DRAFT_926107, partial [Mycena vulgaris]
FNPYSISAPSGTLISFQFSGIPGNHSVTQSKFPAPCTPLANGFDSGFLPGRETKEGKFPTWSYTVMNAQEPIWFYCRQQTPSPHCHAGMVGVINVQAARNTFEEFQAKAERTSVVATVRFIHGSEMLGSTQYEIIPRLSQSPSAQS